MRREVRVLQLPPSVAEDPRRGSLRIIELVLQGECQLAAVVVSRG